MWDLTVPERDPGACGDLGVREVLEEGQLDDAALRLAEEVQLVEQQHPVGDLRCRRPRVTGPAGRACASDIAASVSRRCRSRRAHVSAILWRADARPARPGSGPLSGPVAGAAGPGGDEGLLGDVLGVRARAEGADGHAVDLAGPPLVGQASACSSPAAKRRPISASSGSAALRAARVRHPRLRTLPRSGRPDGEMPAHRTGSATTTTLSR